MNLNGKKIIISRTDSIGDVMLTLPICSWIKEQFPSSTIIFLGKTYTEPIVSEYKSVDKFIDWNTIQSMEEQKQIVFFKKLNADAIIHVFPNKDIASLSKKSGIPIRVGTSHRLFHWWTCSHKINFTRKNSPLHEAQLNHELLRPFGLNVIPSLKEINKTIGYLNIPQEKLPEELPLENITILHPKSQGSAKEWPIEKYMALAEAIALKGGHVVFTGTEKEGKLFRHLIPQHPNIFDSTGTLSLKQFMKLISIAKNLVACSTGPLHISGYYGCNTIGLFSPKRPIHPGRWQPLGEKIQIIVFDENCPQCLAKKDCNCISDIKVSTVLDKIQ